jgi:hypothetical protein
MDEFYEFPAGKGFCTQTGRERRGEPDMGTVVVCVHWTPRGTASSGHFQFFMLRIFDTPKTTVNCFVIYEYIRGTPKLNEKRNRNPGIKKTKVSRR